MPQPSLTFARIRLRCHRQAVITWVAVVVCAATAGFLIASASTTAASAPRHEHTTRVIVATTAIAPGEALDGHLAYRRVPATAVPDGAANRMPIHHAARTALHRGEILTDDRVTGAAGAGPAALLEPGQRGVAVPLPDTAPTLRVGDRVDLVDANGDGGGGDDAVVATGLSVIDARAAAITVAVPASHVPAVAAALAHGSVTVVFAAPGP